MTRPEPGQAPPRIAARRIGKSFATPVLRDVDLEIPAGCIHGLVGENGAGKSTLAKIIVGLERADTGSLALDGRPYRPITAAESRNAGVALCAQELSLVDDLSIAENILLYTSTSAFKRIRRRSAHEKAARALVAIGLDAGPEVRVSRLSLAEKQLVEIARALATNPRLLVLDEPTSALTAPQSDRLHAILRAEARRGVTVIYISHRLRDVLTICDRVSVLRDGQVRLTESAGALREETLIREMAGADADFDAGRRSIEGTRPVHLRVGKLRSAALPHPISFDCRRGEILGLAGLAGSGRTELLNAILCLDRRTGGSVTIRTASGATEIRNPRHAIRCGIGYVAEDRARDGIFRDRDLAFNVTIAGLGRVADRTGRVVRARETAAVSKLTADLGVTSTGIDQSIRELSGGNQQRLMLARWLHCKSRLLLLDEPTRGVDVAAKLAIHEELVRLRDSGVAVVAVSLRPDPGVVEPEARRRVSPRHVAPGGHPGGGVQ
ncbi:MAG: sugar ABC transporter ATP-binding protein [Proteobacteria bacterium]|nr:sugar ABC transporter ATP-binding protein [Pseudomonadota bacterium]